MSTLLGKVKDGVGGAVSTVQGKVQLKNLLCHLRAQIKILEKEKADQIMNLGQTLYRMHQAGPIDFEALRHLLKRIDETECRMAEKQREVDACEATLYGDEHPATETATAAGYTCSCGTRVPTSARFCSGCGKPNPSQRAAENEPQRARAHVMPPPALTP